VTFVRSNNLPLVTTDLVVVETLNLIQARLGHRHAVQVGKRLLNPALAASASQVAGGSLRKTSNSPAR
jgi:hypothetical protein